MKRKMYKEIHNEKKRNSLQAKFCRTHVRIWKCTIHNFSTYPHINTAVFHRANYNAIMQIIAFDIPTA